MALSPRRSAEQWREIVSQFETSGLSQTEFCKQQNLRLSSFSNWYPKFKSPKPDFISLSPPSRDSSERSVELTLGNWLSLVVRC